MENMALVYGTITKSQLDLNHNFSCEQAFIANIQSGANVYIVHEQQRKQMKSTE